MILSKKSKMRRSKRGQNFSQVENGQLWTSSWEMGALDSADMGDDIDHEYKIGEEVKNDEDVENILRRANSLYTKSNWSYDIKDFGTFSLIFSTSKYFRRKF